MVQEVHALRDESTGMIRRDIKVIHVRVLDVTMSPDEVAKIGQQIEQALKATGNDVKFVVVTTSPGVIIDVDWMQPFIKKLDDASVLLKDAEFTAQLIKLVTLARQKRWNNQTPQPGTMY